MGDTLIGIVGNGFVLMGADKSVARSIVVLKQEEDKITVLDGNKMMGAAGPVSDRAVFCEYVQANVHLYRLRHDTTLTTKAAANFTRRELATALRRAPYQVNLLLAGYDAPSPVADATDESGPSLYFIDYLASMHKMNYGAHGYAGYFVLSVLDKEYRPDMSVEDAVALMERCFDMLAARFLIKQPTHNIKIVDKDGIRVLRQD
jgi:20S proteasome subunit beta 4